MSQNCLTTAHCSSRSPRVPQDTARWFQNVPRTIRDGPRRPKTAQDGPDEPKHDEGFPGGACCTRRRGLHFGHVGTYLYVSQKNPSPRMLWDSPRMFCPKQVQTYPSLVWGLWPGPQHGEGRGRLGGWRAVFSSWCVFMIGGSCRSCALCFAPLPTVLSQNLEGK